MDNIDKYRVNNGMSTLDDEKRKKAFMETMKEIDTLNNKLRVDHKDRFGNYHIYGQLLDCKTGISKNHSTFNVFISQFRVEFFEFFFSCTVFRC